MLSRRRDPAAVNNVLVALAAELAPAFPHLHAAAEAQPRGPVAAVLAHLRAAFAHAAGGRTDDAVSTVVTATATTYRLADETTLQVADHARWR